MAENVQQLSRTRKLDLPSNLEISSILPLPLFKDGIVDCDNEKVKVCSYVICWQGVRTKEQLIERDHPNIPDTTRQHYVTKKTVIDMCQR